jgi:hypothetical protein
LRANNKIAGMLRNVELSFSKSRLKTNLDMLKN